MTKINLGYIQEIRTVLYSVDPDALPGTYTVEYPDDEEGDPVNDDEFDVVKLLDFEHKPDGDDLPGHEHAKSHVLYHHIREALYKTTLPAPGDAIEPIVQADPAMFPNGIYDMQRVTILPSGTLALTKYVYTPAVALIGTATKTLVIKGYPQDAVIANNKFNYTSEDVAIATVSAAGVVKGVVPGKTSVKIVHKDDASITHTVPVVVTAT